MEQKFISLLYPDRESRAAAVTPRVRISDAVTEELGLSSLLSSRFSLSPFFTSDEGVIAYRQELFTDLMNTPALTALLRELLPMLHDITELRLLTADHDGDDSSLYSVTEVELYVASIRLLHEGLAPLADALGSRALRRLAEVTASLTESEDHRRLLRELGKLSSRVSDVRSVTIGVNLDATLRPFEAGVLSVNPTHFKSGRVLDKILRMSFKNDSMTTVAPLVPFDKRQNENRRDALAAAFYGALEDVFRSSARGWRAIVGEYVLENADFLLDILPEIEFVTRAAELLERLGARGLPLCVPTLVPMRDKAFAVRGLYNPDVALRIDGEIVENDLTLDDAGRIFLLSGPNRGGKSVFTCAVGLAQAMCQLGLPVAAREAAISPVSAIFTHFPTGADDTLDKGRLGEECARLREIFDAADEDALVLLDESLSSTGAFEASFLAAEILGAFAIRRMRALFSTHLHELCSEVERINRLSSEKGGVAIDTLVAGMEEGRRSFLIHRQKPDGRSYARDIAEKYGLSLDKLTGC